MGDETSAPPPADTIRDSDKVMLVLCYLGLLALIPLLTVKDSDYVKWHARQGLALLICWVGYSIVLGIVGVIPFIGWLIALIGMLGHLGILALMAYALFKAFLPERWKIPFVSEVAAKIPL